MVFYTHLQIANFIVLYPHTRDGHPCLRLTLPATERVADFHRRVIAHAGRTTERTRPGFLPGGFFVLRLCRALGGGFVIGAGGKEAASESAEPEIGHCASKSTAVPHFMRPFFRAAHQKFFMLKFKPT